MNRRHMRKNFGFGRSTRFAVKQALKDKFGEGRYQTRQAHLTRAKLFCEFLHVLGVDDFRLVEQDDLEAYAMWVAEAVQLETYSLAYGTNLLSSANVVMECLREDNCLKVSPSEFVGRRSHRRKKQLNYLPLNEVEELYQEFLKEDPVVAFTFAYARLLGMRLRETVMFQPKEGLQQHRKKGKVNITRGTKGGRKSERWVATSTLVEQVLIDSDKFTRKIGSKNMISPNQSLIIVYRHIEYKLRTFLKAKGFGTIHDLRALYACDRMHELTGHSAPILGGKIKDKAKYYEHAKTVSKELGHNREYVINSYCG